MGCVYVYTRYTQYLMCVCLCWCWETKSLLNRVSFSQASIFQNPKSFLPTRKRSKTTWTQNSFSINDFKILLVHYGVIICAYFVWRLESQPRINLWPIVPWSTNTLGVSGQHKNTPTFSEYELHYRYTTYIYVCTLNHPTVYLGQ